MTAEQFAYWLQGFAELNDGATPTPAQWASIQDHLKLVFTKVTPPVGLRDLGELERSGIFQRAVRTGDPLPDLSRAIC